MSSSITSPSTTGNTGPKIRAEPRTENGVTAYEGVTRLVDPAGNQALAPGGVLLVRPVPDEPRAGSYERTGSRSNCAARAGTRNT